MFTSMAWLASGGTWSLMYLGVSLFSMTMTIMTYAAMEALCGGVGTKMADLYS